MNLALFIANRYFSSTFDKDNISTTYAKVAVTAVTISLAVMVSAMGMGFGLQRQIKDKVANFGAHIKVLPFSSQFSEENKKKVLDLQAMKPYTEIHPHLVHQQPVVSLAGLIRTDEAFHGVMMKGVDSTFRLDQFADKLVEGRLPNFAVQQFETMLSATIARQLKLKIGDRFQVTYIIPSRKYPAIRQYTLVGIFETDWKEFDDNVVLTHMDPLQQLLRWKPTEVEYMEYYADNTSELKRMTRSMFYKVGQDKNVVSILDEYEEVFNWVALFDTNIYIVLVLMIMVAVINIMTVLLIMMFERRAFVGMLKSMGGSNALIRKVFIYKAAYIIFRGLIYGNAVALIILATVKYGEIITLNPEVYFVSSLPAEINWLHFLIANSLIFVVCVLSMWIPTYMITKIHPAKAIKMQ